MFCAFVFVSLPVTAAEPGDRAPGFANPDLTGVYHTSKTAVGRSWLVLDFFATDCEPCLRELPELSLLAAEWAPRGLSVLVFATDPAGEPAVGRFFESLPPAPYTVLIDRYRVTAERYGVRVIPSLFLVDPSGTIRYAAEGYGKETLREVRRLLEAGFRADETPDESAVIPSEADAAAGNLSGDVSGGDRNDDSRPPFEPEADAPGGADRGAE